MYIYFIPEVNISYAEKRNEECLSPHPAHAQFTSDLLFCKVVFQHTEQKQIIAWSFDSIAVDVSIHRNLDICAESHLDVFRCRVPVSLATKSKEAYKKGI